MLLIPASRKRLIGKINDTVKKIKLPKNIQIFTVSSFHQGPWNQVLSDDIRMTVAVEYDMDMRPATTG